jgi:hypothetical protein
LNRPGEPEHAILTGDIPTLELRGHSYEEHRTMIPALVEALAACGCWILEQRALSPTQAELYFEVQLRAAFELYSGIVAAGVELTRDSHTRMSGLCTLRGHNPRQARRRRVVSVRLGLSFLEDTPAIDQGIVIGIA